MSASSSATRTRCGFAASVSDPVMEHIVAVVVEISDLGGILYGGRPRRVPAPTPSYPNWQRKRIQNPSSVSSSLTEGTLQTHSTRLRARRGRVFSDERH